MRRLASLMVVLFIVIGVGSFNQKSAEAQGSTWTQQARLTRSDTEGVYPFNFSFGHYSALSGDGKMALIITLGNGNQGAIYIYLQKNGRWYEHQRIDCPASGCGQIDNLAPLVAVSYDGAYAVVGNKGAVLVHNGEFWEYQQSLLPANAFTYAIAVSADGSTIALGNPQESNGGAAYVYVRNGSAWMLQKYITPPNSTEESQFGRFVALSGDGSVALISVTTGHQSESYGRAYFYTRAAESWNYNQEVAETNAGLGSYFGYWTALSADGNTALISDPWATCFTNCSGGNRGLVYFFKRIGSIWQKLQGFGTDNSPTNYGHFGGSLSLSSDGKSTLISTNTVSASGAPYDSSAYIYVENGGIWTQQQQITISDQNIEHFGISVSMSGDGNTLLIGVDEATVNNHAKMGAAYIYSNQPAVVPTIFPDHPGVYYNGAFYLRESNTSGNADTVSYFGGDPSDLPIAGDWNGDGISTIGVYRGSGGQFFLSDSNTAPNVRYTFTFGNPGDAPLAGRWDAEITRDGVGVYRNSNGILYLKDYLSTGFSDYFAVFGNPDDQGVAGDWDGDGFDSVGIYRPANQTWYLTNNHTPSGITFSDLAFYNAIVGPGQPITGDWNADGISTTGSYFATVSGVFTECVTNANPVGCSAIGFGPNGGRGVTGYWGLTPSKPSPVYGVLQPAAPSKRDNSDDSGGVD